MKKERHHDEFMLCFNDSHDSIPSSTLPPIIVLRLLIHNIVNVSVLPSGDKGIEAYICISNLERAGLPEISSNQEAKKT
jgi:hypothetical protein